MAAKLIKGKIIGVHQFGPKEEPTKYTRVYVTYPALLTGGGMAAGYLFGSSDEVYKLGDEITILDGGRSGLQEVTF